MAKITARISEQLVGELDRAAGILARSRAEVIRRAIKYYLQGFEDLSLGLEALRDPADAVLDWEEVRAELLADPLTSL